MFRHIENIHEVIRDKGKLEKLYHESFSMKEVAKKLGCGETLVHTWIHRLGITPKPNSVTLRSDRRTKEWKQKVSKYAKTRLGELNSNWRDGATSKGLILRSKNYRQRRRAVLDRDNYECQECGCDMDLHTHHIKPVKDYPELVDELSNLITLCAKCHRALHFPEKNLANSVNPRTGNAELSVRLPDAFYNKADWHSY